MQKTLVEQLHILTEVWLDVTYVLTLAPSALLESYRLNIEDKIRQIRV